MNQFNLQTKIFIILGIIVAAVFAFFSWSAFGGGTTLGVTLGGSNSGTSLADGLVGHWTFDGANPGIDESGNGNDGSLSGVSTTSAATAGVIGQAFEFDGVDDYVEVSGNAGNFGSQYSVSVWVWVDPADSNSQNIPISNRSGGTNYFGVRPSTERTFWYANTAGTPDLSGVSGALTKGEWHNVVYIRQSSTHRKIFVDGALDVERTGESAVSSDTGTLWFGKDPIPNFYHGKLDNIRIYDRALSASEIKRLYQLGATTKLNKTLDGNKEDDGPVAHWTFDGKDVVENVADVSGNGNTAFLQNFSATNTALTIGNIGGAVSTGGATNHKITTNVDIGSEWTATAWFKYPLTTTGATWWTLFRGSSDHQIIINRGTNLLGVYDNGGTSFNSSGFDTSTLADGWHHIATIGEGTTQDFYIDGSLVGTASFKSTSDITTIGNCPCDNQNWGVFDDVRIYDRALSADEVQRLYQLGATTKLNKTLEGNKEGSGPVGHWTFDGKDVVENVADISGNANHGKMQNFTATNTALTRGRLGQGIEFDGVDDVVNVDDSPVLDMGTNNFTVSAWIQTSANSGGIVSKGDNDAWWQFKVSSSKLSFSLSDGTTGVGNLRGNVDPTDNAWHHALVVVNRGSGEANLYFDGVFDATLDISSVTGSVDNNVVLRVGESRTGSENFSGKIDDVRIYDSALSAEEVKRLYNLGR